MRYLPSGAEVDLLEHAHGRGLPVMLTGPTGCGKTRLVEHVAERLGRPLVTISCHDDLTSADLVGRFLVTGGDVTWSDGPLTRAVREGAVCYLDEVVEARHDSLAILHSLTDHRRALFLDRTGESVSAPAGFMLVCSYNPAYRSTLKELKPSFRQRFVTVELDYLDAAREAEVVAAETGVAPDAAGALVRCAAALRNADDALHLEPPSTRTLVNAGHLVASGVGVAEAAQVCILGPLTTDGAIGAALREVAAAALGAPVAPVAQGAPGAQDTHSTQDRQGGIR